MSDTIEHYGILGMKWGRRRATPSSADHLRVAALQPKKARELSNDELKLAINRLQLEKQYNELNTKQLSAGEKFVRSILSKEANRQASMFVAEYGTTVVKSAFKAASNYTPPNPTSKSTNSAPKDYVDSYFVKND